ncbi:molybdenum-containing sulfite:cytochrome c oxidoreductase SorAB, monoheme cytochrome c subunit [Malaciobacter marinus]|uniref:Molybdenum-containing sulfite:cytochrome c oxidoreductase SorAB, monoheme cytochrome c subunit n=1 Tax=Malaciobacter marinus TaxID=505249 RepID=A0A347TKT0_9BACT|nr:sulfite oxidase [Malaciobacter marinus]AXX87208.1 molybdenum-containing sulfite:cytochrome c oxidoreductase SorAB, monoheme cytochrome c subunit [Malaciobacter marinus]PHO14870.1 molybdopterin containing oxidoreductase [Malaciobacter marinus]
MAKNKKKIGIHEAYYNDPIKADLELFGRETDSSRRGFLRKSSLIAMAAIVGSNIPFADKMPSGLIPAALANSQEPFKIEGKEGLIYLNDRPVNAETPPHLLNDEFTQAKYMFIRNNGIPPKKSEIDLENWTLEISGESCKKPMKFSINELKKKFKHYTYALQLECGGNGRSEYNPPAKGNQWTTGAVACGRWTGVRLKDVLEYCGIKKDAVYIGYYGADKHLSGDLSKEPISRGAPISKALENESLIAWAYEGENIPLYNGYPLRLVMGGWPASVSGKWLNKIVIRNKVHDGKKMAGQSYRVPCNTVAPGTKVADEDMCIIESMPVKSLITFPKSGIKHDLNKKFKFNGKAWAGDLEVKQMEVSIDFGATWKKVKKLDKPINRLAWQTWYATLKFPKKGYYEVWARATDSNNKKQPTILPGWNPRGYLNNACHRIAVQVV